MYMPYSFVKSPVASVKISQWRGNDGSTLALNGINGSMSSADSLVAGVQQLLGIVGLQNEVTPTKISRVVTENVVSN